MICTLSVCMCNLWISTVMEEVAVGFRLTSGYYLLLKCKQRLLCFMVVIGFILSSITRTRVSLNLQEGICMTEPLSNIFLQC